MTEFEFFSLIFFDSLMSKIAFVPQKQIFLDVASQISNQPKSLIFIFSTIGFLIGCSINFFIGKILVIARKKDSSSQEKFLTNFSKKFNQFATILLAIFAYSKFGTILTLISGITNFNKKAFLNACLFSIIWNLILVIYL